MDLVIQDSLHAHLVQNVVLRRIGVDASVGGVMANAYADVAYADAFFANFYPYATAWDEAADDDKELALIHATRELETYSYVGTRATTTQALKWPRELEDDELILRRYDSTVIPPPIKDANCLWALKKLVENESSSTVTGTSPVKSLQIGSSVKVGYDTSVAVVDTSIDFSGIPREVALQLKGLRLYAVVA